MILDIKPKARLNTPHETQSPSVGHSKPECTSCSGNEIFLSRLAGRLMSGLETGLPTVNAGEKTSIAVVQLILWTNICIKTLWPLH